MLKEERVDLAASASAAAYYAGRHGIGPGFELDLRFWERGFVVDEDTGFKAVALYSADSNEAVVAFAGTDEGTQDAYANLLLGANQWSRNGSDVVAYSKRVVESGAKLLLTGHSLGGALAQYAAYDLLAALEGSPRSGDVLHSLEVATFNSLGGVAGLQDRYEDVFNPSLLDPIASNINHFYVEGDLIARLGEGHVGGQTYLVPNL
jgi:hypothetical protein